MSKEDFKVSNISKLPQVVPIISKDGKTRTTISVMPKARPTLPPGFRVDPNWMALNPGKVVLIRPQEPKAPSNSKSAQEVAVKEQK